MNKYQIVLTLTVQVDAFGADDALEAVEDIFGPGVTAGLLVTNLKVEDVTQL